jgi:uncharacterized membrane protein
MANSSNICSSASQADVSARSRDDARSCRRAFLAIGLLFGLLFCGLNPPYLVDDEFAHMWRIYDLTQGWFVSRRDQEGVYSTWPEAGMQYLERFQYLRKADQKHFDASTLLRDFDTPWDERREVKVAAHAANYSLICYLPQLPVVALARWLSLAPPYHLYLARLASLCAYLGLGCLALHWAGSYRYVLFMLSLTPMALWQGSGVSADCMTNALALLLASWVVSCSARGSQPFSRAEAAVSVLLVAMLGLCKFIYAPLGLLLLAIPAQRFAGRRRKFAVCAAIGLCSAVPAVLCLYAFRAELGTPGGGVDPGQQLRRVLDDPLQLLIPIGHTLRREIWLQVRMFVGHFGRKHTAALYLPQAVVVGFLAALAGVIRLCPIAPELRLSRPAQRLIGTVGLGLAAAIFCTMYLLGTKVGTRWVTGVQGRYFIPLAFPLALAAASRWSLGEQSAFARWVPHIAISGSSSALFASVWLLLRVYYL